MNDEQVVDAFVEYLRQNGHPCLSITRRPDRENRETPDIDAIADPFAIEHTSIDSVPEQRKRDAWFMAAVGALEQQFAGKIAFRLQITFEYEAITIGQDWKAIRTGLARWIAIESPRLSDGRHVIEGVDGVPFDFTAIKRSTWHPKLVFYRTTPDGGQFVSRLGEAMRRKAEKLRRYSRSHRTILLVESCDIALMNEAMISSAVEELTSAGLPDGVSEIWFADTSIPEHLDFQLLVG